MTEPSPEAKALARELSGLEWHEVGITTEAIDRVLRRERNAADRLAREECAKIVSEGAVLGHADFWHLCKAVEKIRATIKHEEKPT